MAGMHPPHPPFRNHAGFFPETRRSPSVSNGSRNMGENPANTGRFAAAGPRLSVHLMSLWHVGATIKEAFRRVWSTNKPRRESC